MTTWKQLISTKRTGSNSKNVSDRTDFQRDFDRLIFSSAFRRLQNKTQVFPLPGAVFVHNRLTHSLETASVGRSLGKIVGEKLVELEEINPDDSFLFCNELPNIIASAALAHDIGNPPFGHSGEKAIANYFQKNRHLDLGEGTKLKDYFAAPGWKDLINFEGNANSLRVLTRHFQGKSKGGYRLTYSTLAAMVKYPLESLAMDTANKTRKKFGVFQSDKQILQTIFLELKLDKIQSEPLVFKRNPFAFLTEAADDICYLIIDMEDAHRLKILPLTEVKEDFMELYESVKPQPESMDRINSTVESITDANEKISYLRAKCINALTLKAADLFIENRRKILAGTYNETLMDNLANSHEKIKDLTLKSIQKIYNHQSVLELEIAGFLVMEKLLSLFVPAMLRKDKQPQDKKMLKLIPKQFEVSQESTPYEKVLSVLDYLSGMTDPYVTDLYKKIVGIEFAKHI